MTKRTCNNECGNSFCCTKLITIRNKSSLIKDELKMYLHKNVEVRYFKSKNEEDMFILIHDHPCSQLTDTGCKLKGKDKLQICNEFPEKEDWILPKNCKFYDAKYRYSTEDFPRVTLENCKMYM